MLFELFAFVMLSFLFTLFLSKLGLGKHRSFRAGQRPKHENDVDPALRGRPTPSVAALELGDFRTF